MEYLAFTEGCTVASGTDSELVVVESKSQLDIMGTTGCSVDCQHYKIEFTRFLF